jgi:hypothetical protein
MRPVNHSVSFTVISKHEFDARRDRWLHFLKIFSFQTLQKTKFISFLSISIFLFSDINLSRVFGNRNTTKCKGVITSSLT